MKKTVVKIGKSLLVAALLLVATLAVIGIVGEPSDKWYKWTSEWLGVFAGLGFVAMKMLCIGVVYLCYKAAVSLKVAAKVVEG